MSYVLDTHALAWYLTNDKNLSAAVKEVLDSASDAQETVFVPTIVLAVTSCTDDLSQRVCSNP